MKKGITTILAALMGAAAGAGTLNYQKVKQHEKDCAVIKKNDAILKMFNQWLIIKQQGKSIADYLKENGYQKVAIYGMSYAGERLLDDLVGRGIEVVYVVDQKADRMFADVDLVTKDQIDRQKKIDTVIVTAIYFFDDIEEELSEIIQCPIISLEDIIYEM